MPIGMDIENAIFQKGSAPRRKRYLLLLINKSEPSRDLKTLEKAIDASAQGMIVLRTDDPDEALKFLLIRNVELIIIDSNFLPDNPTTVEFARELKHRKLCPILFITANELTLVSSYREQMALFEELDDYVLSPVDFVEITKRLRRMSSGDGRAAKRFLINAPVRCHILNDESTLPGTLMDLSIVGFGMRLTSPRLLQRGEQLRIKIPLGFFGIFHPELGESLNIAGKLRRNSLDGAVLGCSIEHMTTLQREVLVQILEKVARRKRAANPTVTNNAPQGSKPNALPATTSRK